VKYKEKGLKDGTCADQGYTHKTGTQTKTYPIIGDILITIYALMFLFPQVWFLLFRQPQPQEMAKALLLPQICNKIPVKTCPIIADCTRLPTTLAASPSM
jgi:hypothetical protein